MGRIRVVAPLVAVLLVVLVVVLVVAGSGVAAAKPVTTTTTNAAVVRADDDLMRAVIADVQAFWAAELPEVYGIPFDPIPAARLVPYSASNPPPGCGGSGTIPYEDVADNAFYCSLGDFLAWDTAGLIHRLRTRYGDFAVALVAAHELGHVVQERTSTTAQSTIPLELQADCLTGAWVAHATTTTGDEFDVATSDLEQALSGYLYFRDPTGTDPRTEGAHGSAFDRISAFTDGFTEGASRCKGYDTDPPTVTEIPYTSSSDEANEGNLPFARILTLARRELNSYWKRTTGRSPASALVADAAKARACAQGTDRPVKACAAGVIAYSRKALRSTYDTYGDFAVATLLAEAWADAARNEGRVEVADAPRRRPAECLAGAWAGDIVNGAGAKDTTISPGDLDEAVAVLLAFAGRATTSNSAFVRFEAFRTGFDEGAAACGLETAASRG